MSDPGMGPADDLSGTVIACAIVSLVVSGIALGLRFYSRGVITRVLGREDWCILIAWVNLPPAPMPSDLTLIVDRNRF